MERIQRASCRRSAVRSPSPRRRRDGDGKDQVRHAGRPLHLRIGCGVRAIVAEAEVLWTFGAIELGDK
jgi:hypothetical protein